MTHQITLTEEQVTEIVVRRLARLEGDMANGRVPSITEANFKGGLGVVRWVRELVQEPTRR